MSGRIELSDPGDDPGDLSGSVDLVFSLTGRFVDEGRSEGGISSEQKCTTAHRSLGRGPTKTG